MDQQSVIHCPLHGVKEFTPCDPAEIRPLLAHLEANLPVSGLAAFPRGTVLEDGRLDLCKQNLGPGGCRLVTEALSTNTTISSLLLGTDGIGNTGAADVARLLGHNKHLQVVYLGCNQIEDAGVAELASVLTHNTSVTGLWLKRNPVGPAGTRALAEMLRYNRTLRTLDLVNTQIRREGQFLLLEALTGINRTVERLYLGGNGIEAEDSLLLAGLVRSNPNLKALLLNVNHLGDAGVMTLADGLKENRTLIELGLASNGITARGGAALAAALQDHPMIASIDLGYSPSSRVLGALPNALGDTGAEAFAQLLEHNGALRKLDLRQNGITEEGKASLIGAMEQNTSLQQLLLDGKQDGTLRELLDRNRTANPRFAFHYSSDVALIRSVYRTA